MPSDQPDWAALPVEIWTSALRSLCAREDDQLQWARLLVSVSTVSRALRSAVLGPDAVPLWRDVTFRSKHKDLDAVQSRQLNRLLASQGQHVHRAKLTGGCWDLQELREAAASLTGQLEHLRLHLNNDAEADILGSVLPGCRVEHVNCSGACMPALPRSLHTLELCLNTRPSPDLVSSVAFMLQQMQAVFRQLQPLPCLTSLRLVSTLWTLQPADVACIAECLPRLKVLTLCLVLHSLFGQHAVGALSRLPSSVQLSVSLTSMREGMAPTIRALAPVQLACLNIQSFVTEGYPNPYVLTPEDEAALAQCRMAELSLCMIPSEPAERLQRLLPGVRVVHRC